MAIKGLNTISVTATPQRVSLPDSRKRYTLRNEGASLVAFRYDATKTVVTGFAGTESELRAMSANVIYPNEVMVVGPDASWLDFVCPTGGTATVNVECGEFVASGERKTLASTGKGVSAVGGANAEAIAENSTPFNWAIIQAKKPGADANDDPTGNTSDIYVSAGNNQYAQVLAPGNSIRLEGGDLKLVEVAVGTADDGVTVIYSPA